MLFLFTECIDTCIVRIYVELVSLVYNMYLFVSTVLGFNSMCSVEAPLNNEQTSKLFRVSAYIVACVLSSFGPSTAICTYDLFVLNMPFYTNQHVKIDCDVLIATQRCA